MKIVYAGTFSGIHVSDNYRNDGFKRVFEKVISYDFRGKIKEKGQMLVNEEIIQLIKNEKPNIFFINNGNGILPDAIKRIKKISPYTMVCMWYGDQRGKALKEVADLAKECDYLLLNNKDEAQWQDYRNMGIKEIDEYHSASDTCVYTYMDREEKYDIAFFGTNYGKRFPESINRFNLMTRLHHKFNLIVYGGHWPISFNRGGRVYGEDFSMAVSKAKITIGINAYNNINHYTSNRMWNCMACGKPFLSWYYLGMEDFFKNWKHLVWFRNINEAYNIIDRLLKDKELRKSIGAGGRSLIKRNHDYINRASELKMIYTKWASSRGIML